MFRLPELRRLFRLPVRRASEIRREIDTEVEYHLEMRVAELKALGRSDADARAEATRRFGDVSAARRSLHQANATNRARRVRRQWVGDLARDIVLALRGFHRTPLFTVVAVTTLAVGIGLTTAVVSVLDRMMVHPLPYPEADRLVTIWFLGGTPGHSMLISPEATQVDLWRRGSRTLDRVEGYQTAALMVELGGPPEILPVSRVTPGLPGLLGARVRLGRAFVPGDADRGAPLPAMLSWGTWQRRFGGAADVLGRPIRVDRQAATIVGVFDRRFDLASLNQRSHADVWLPIRSDTAAVNMAVVALLKPGARAGAVGPDLMGLLLGANAHIRKGFELTANRADQLRDGGLRRDLWLALAAVGLVLLIACANVAGLFLARTASRGREFGVRAALGAGAGRVARQSLTEALLLGAVGCALGLVVAELALAVARLVRPAGLLALDDARLEPRILLVAMVAALGSGLLFGLALLWGISRADPLRLLVRRDVGPSRRVGGIQLRGGLVVGELAMSTVLLIGAGLLVKSFVNARNLPLGFDEHGLGQVGYALPAERFKTAAERAAIEQQILERVRAIPGIQGATLAESSPMSFGVMKGQFLIDGVPIPSDGDGAVMPAVWIRPDFFAVTGTRLVAGRALSGDSTVLEVVIDQATAKRHWPAGDAVGRRIRFNVEAPWRTIVGVAARQRLIDRLFEGVPMIYEPSLPGSSGGYVLARMANPSALPSIGAALLALDADIRLTEVRAVSSLVDDELAESRFVTMLMLVFAVLALALAAIGLYGVIAYGVEQRTYEIGVRIALGAAPVRVLLLVIRDGIRRICLGVAIGGLASIWLVRFIRESLYEVRPWDPTVFAIAAIALALAALTASWIPARRAAGVDPLIALKSD